MQPFTSGDPTRATDAGPNETAACMAIEVFFCPSDFDRMPSRPWRQNNYRSCNGGSWSGRAGDGMFGQSTRIGPADIRDGLSNTAAMSERIRGHDDYQNVDVKSDQFRVAAPWTEAAFTEWCAGLTDAEAIALPMGATGDSPAHRWRAALEDVTEQAAEIHDAMSAVSGEHRNLVVTGGWSRSEAFLAVKRRRFGNLTLADVSEAGARGAASFAAKAATA